MFPEGFQVWSYDGEWTFSASLGGIRTGPEIDGPTMADAITEAVKHAAKVPA